jgi:hypothetical protein
MSTIADFLLSRQLKQAPMPQDSDMLVHEEVAWHRDLAQEEKPGGQTSGCSRHQFDTQANQTQFYSL